MASNIAGDAGFGWLVFWRKADFTTKCVLGKGGYGIVKSMGHRQLNQVAVKELTRRTLKDTQNWLKEIGLLACLHHEHIVGIFGCIVDGDRLSIVMELATHGSVHTLMSTLDPPERIPLSITMRVLLQVALGMSYLHLPSNNILHLDLKAANVLITHRLIAKITDFGLGEWRTYAQTETVELEESTEDDRSGTWTHVPPEILENKRLKPGRKFDVYSFAILTWEMLSGKEASDGFDAPDPAYVKLKIIAGERPDVKMLCEESPSDSKQLMVDCWNGDFRERPDFSQITERMREIFGHYQYAILCDETSLRVMIAKHQGSETLEDPTDAETLPLRALRLAKQQMTEQLHQPSCVAAMLCSWEKLDLGEYLCKLKGCKSVSDRAAAMVSAVQGKDEVATLALLSALSLTGQDELVNRIYITARDAAADLKQDKNELTWWMLVFKMDNVDSTAEALASNGFITDDGKNISQVQPTRLQKAHALLSSVLSCKKNGMEFLRAKIKKGQMDLLQDSDSLDQLCTLWSIPLLSQSHDLSTQDVRKSASWLAESSSACPHDRNSSGGPKCLENESETNTLRVYTMDFDERGGVLCSDNCSVKLTVPAGSLNGPQKLYFKILADQCGERQGTFSMLFECGPSGLHFKKPVKLTVPHCAPSTALLSAAVKSAGSKRFLPSDMVVETEADCATISMHHFSTVTLMALPLVMCDRHWWLFACRRIPLFVFGFFYPDASQSRIYYAYMYDDLYEELCRGELSSGQRCIRSKCLMLTLCPEYGNLVCEDCSTENARVMISKVATLFRERHTSIDLPMMTSGSVVKVYQEFGSCLVLVFDSLCETATDQIQATLDEASSVRPTSGLVTHEPPACESHGASYKMQPFGKAAADYGELLRFDPSTCSSITVPVVAHDIGRTAKGSLIIATLRGFVEYDENGKEISRYELHYGHFLRDSCHSVDILEDGRVVLVAVDEYLTCYIVLQRDVPGGSKWLVDQFLTLPGTPNRWFNSLSAHGNVLALFDHSRRELVLVRLPPPLKPHELDYVSDPLTHTAKQLSLVAGDVKAASDVEQVIAWKPGKGLYQQPSTSSRLEPRSLRWEYVVDSSRKRQVIDGELLRLQLDVGRELRRLRLDYKEYVHVAATAETVVVAYRPRSGPQQFVVESYSYTGSRVWTKEWDEEVSDICAARSGQVLYLALPESGCVAAVSSHDGRRLAGVLNLQGKRKCPHRLSASRGPRAALAVLGYHQNTVCVYPEVKVAVAEASSVRSTSGLVAHEPPTGESLGESCNQPFGEAAADHSELRFEPAAISSFSAVDKCDDVAVTADGLLLVGSFFSCGFIEFDASGKEMSRWPTREQLESHQERDFRVRALDVLEDGRVVVALYESVVLLWRHAGGGGKWLVDQYFYLRRAEYFWGCALSVRADLMAVVYSMGPTSSSEIRLLRLPSPLEEHDLVRPPKPSTSDSRMSRCWKPGNVVVGASSEHDVSSREAIQVNYWSSTVAIIAHGVVVASNGRVDLSDGRLQFVVDSYNYEGSMMWRQAWDEKMSDVCAAPSGQVLYLALPESGCVAAVSSQDGRRLATVLNLQGTKKCPRRLSSSRCKKSALAVLGCDQKTVSVYPAVSSAWGEQPVSQLQA